MIKIKTNNIHLIEKKYILSVIFTDILGLKFSHEICENDVFVTFAYVPVFGIIHFILMHLVYVRPQANTATDFMKKSCSNFKS